MIPSEAGSWFSWFWRHSEGLGLVRPDKWRLKKFYAEMLTANVEYLTALTHPRVRQRRNCADELVSRVHTSQQRFFVHPRFLKLFRSFPPSLNHIYFCNTWAGRGSASWLKDVLGLRDRHCRETLDNFVVSGQLSPPFGHSAENNSVGRRREVW